MKYNIKKQDKKRYSNTKNFHFLSERYEKIKNIKNNNKKKNIPPPLPPKKKRDLCERFEG